MAMQSKILEHLRLTSPTSHLHTDVTLAGQNSYRILAAIVGEHGEVLVSIDHYGSGDLEQLKEQAFQRLYQELDTLKMVQN
jgi:hypothetical protein